MARPLKVLKVRARAWRLSTERAAAFALLLPLALSVQFILQPFVWRNFSLPEIAFGWASIVAENAAVTFAITAGLAAAGRLPLKRVGVRALTALAVILSGATLGELAADWALGQPVSGFEGLMKPVARWTVIAAGLALIYYSWLRRTTADLQVAEARQRRARLEQLARQTELNILQRQIEPHFLFNSLATARGLYRKSPAEGAALLSHLAAFLRANLGANTGTASLARELTLVRAYLGICAARMGKRLAVDINGADQFGNRDFPPLVLATLVENAIVHGLEPRPRGGKLSICFHEANGRLEAEVSDDGVGLSEAATGSGMGLSNTRARLAVLYGSGAGLRLCSGESDGVTAQVWLPSAVAG